MGQRSKNNMKEIMSRAYTRYHFVESSPNKKRTPLMTSMDMMDDEERRASDLAAYHKVKQIERATPMEDGSLSVYLISGKWIN